MVEEDHDTSQDGDDGDTGHGGSPDSQDARHMRRAIALAAGVRTTTSPNPWVGCVIVTADGRTFEGATQPPGGPHAEAVALAAARAAGADLTGATVYTTLEPCSHVGRTAACATALVEAKVGRVVVGIEDPDWKVAGSGLRKLRVHGITVDTGVEAEAVTEQLRPYLHHRRTGRPYVILKMAATLDGGTAAPDGTSRWITGPEARADVHRLRAESDAVLVGAGTVRADDPELTVRDAEGPDPLRVVLGTAPPEAKVHPCLEVGGEPGTVLDELGEKGVLQLLVEGGATVAASFHHRGLVDRYVLYLAPAFFGGHDAVGLFNGRGAATMADVWRGRILAATQLGADLRIDVVPDRH
ncbi:MAG TPA: bifunctional diaminohydroxyphosphoribosylaminopyrimidine deaminase/5-amino-6-(5-phosphoribosylamino)uracil reductase RibD [Acidimicrobiales bacterium]